MIISPVIISITLVLLVSALLIITGLKRAPGIGIIGATVIIVITLILRQEHLGAIGFGAPKNWLTTILLGFFLGLTFQLLSIVLVEPLCERLTGSPLDYSALGNLRSNWKSVIQLLLLVWVVVAALEEGIFRGFLMTEITRVTGTGPGAMIISISVSSAVFGLAHGYQGHSGILSTGITGVLLALVFVLSGFNLWLAIFTHGFVDTIGIVLMASGGDRLIRQTFWPEHER